MMSALALFLSLFVFRMTVFLSLCSGCPCWPCFSLCVQNEGAGLVSLFVFRMTVLALFLCLLVFKMTVLALFLSLFVFRMTVLALFLSLCSG